MTPVEAMVRMMMYVVPDIETDVVGASGVDSKPQQYFSIVSSSSYYSSQHSLHVYSPAIINIITQLNKT